MNAYSLRAKNLFRQDERECRAELLEAKATIMLYEEKLQQLEGHPVHIEDPVKEVASREIQTDTQVTEANSPEVEGSISEQDVTDRINREKEKLGEMMEDLKQRILELEESRKNRETVTSPDILGESKSKILTQLELNDAIQVGKFKFNSI